MPLIVTGIAAGTTGIVDYTAARVITTGDTAGTAYTIGSLLQIPINVLYSPTSDESVYKTATIYFYADGLLWTFTGALGTPSLELTTGGIGFVSFEMRAQFASKSATAVPAGAAAVLRPTPPRFVGGKCQLNKALAQVRTLTINAGVNVILPDDPESAEGYGAALPIERDVAGNLDPYMNTTNSVALFNAFRTGTPMSLMAIIGSTASKSPSSGSVQICGVAVMPLAASPASCRCCRYPLIRCKSTCRIDITFCDSSQVKNCCRSLRYAAIVLPDMPHSAAR
jgi:hypothetical protein